MKVSHEGINDFECVRWINEDGGFSFYRCNSAVIIADCLKCTSCSRTDGDNSLTLSLRLVNYLRRIFTNFKFLGMHLMLADIINFDGFKCTKSDMKKYFCNSHTFGFYLAKKFIGKMQTCCRCSNCSGSVSEDSLVACLIEVG